MAYAVLQDMVDRFGTAELMVVADDGSGQISQAAIDAVLADASALVDGYAANRYILPLNPVPSVVLRLVCDLGRYFLYKDEASDAVTAGYNNALRSLRDISTGVLVLEAGGLADPGTSHRVVISAPATVFTADAVRWFTDDALGGF